jgi:hypothetical protein
MELKRAMPDPSTPCGRPIPGVSRSQGEQPVAATPLDTPRCTPMFLTFGDVLPDDAAAPFDPLDLGDVLQDQEVVVDVASVLQALHVTRPKNCQPCARNLDGRVFQC